jgi:hypothetical protein
MSRSLSFLGGQAWRATICPPRTISMITASVTPLIPRDLVGRLAQPIFGAMRTKGRRDSVDKRWKQQGSGNESEGSDEWGQAIAAVGVSKWGERNNAYIAFQHGEEKNMFTPLVSKWVSAGTKGLGGLFTIYLNYRFPPFFSLLVGFGLRCFFFLGTLFSLSTSKIWGMVLRAALHVTE